MWVKLVLGLLLLAQGEADFVVTRADGRELTSATMEVDLEVRLRNSEGPVVVHLFLPGESEQVRPLVDRGGGRWGTVQELRRADWRVVFEDVATGAVSDESSLLEMGLDPGLLGLLPRGRATDDHEQPNRAVAAAPATFVGLALVGAGVAWFASSRRPGRHTP